MSVKLVYANHTEELLAALVRDLDAFRGEAGPLEPARLIVPNRNIDAYVKLGIARATGIAANIDARFLEGFAADLVASHPDRLRLIDDRVIQGMVLAQLLDSTFLRELWAAPLRNYIFAAGDGDSAADLRRVQLSAQLAHLFEEYGYSRPDMIDAWSRRPVLQHTAQRDVEVWQRHLWAHMFGPGGALEARCKRTGERWVDLRAFIAEVEPSEVPLPPRVFAFGFSYFAPLFHRLLAWLSDAIDVHVYALNPCKEFWEDVRRRDDPDDPFGLTAPGENPLLRRWGRPGREHVRLLNEVTGCDFEDRFVDPRAEVPTLLQQLQADVLDRAGERAEPPADLVLSGDPHIKVMKCPSVARECEIVADEIWQLVDDSDSLSFNDVAVIVPPAQQDAYLTHLAAAFREAHELPHHVVDAPLSSQSRLVEAVGALLALPLGAFARRDLLGLVTHPVVMQQFPSVEPDEWLDACDDLGIVHGADHADHANTYIRRDVFNWDQGLKRLALGAFMEGPRSGEQRAIELGGQPYVPEERPPSQRAGAALFGLLVRSLIADARFARTARMPLAEWAGFLSAYVTSYIPAGDEQDERDRLRCLARIHELEDLQLGDTEVSYRVAYELVWSAVSGMRGARGDGLGDGVVVSSFAPMRAIPFRVVFVVGMGEGLFPAAAFKDHLDLRQARRRPGDVNARERDRYAFLETLLCARERLVLSYVARDELTGEPLSPSSVVQELSHAVATGYLGRAEPLFETRPLRRYDDDLVAIPEASRERRARALGAEVRAALGGPVGGLEPQAVREALGAEAWSRLGGLLGIVEPPDAPLRREAGVETVDVSISALRRFLDCPLQGAARYLLRLSDDDEADVLATEDEPFGLSFLDDIVFLREVFGEVLRRGCTLERAYAERAALRELQGHRPTGVFGEVLRDRHLRDLACWQSLYAEVPHGGAPPEVYRFGRAEELADVERILDPVAFELELADGRRVRVQVSGRSCDVVDTGTVLFAKRSQKGNGWFTKARNARDWLRAFLDQVVLAASGVRHGTGHGAYVCIASAGEPVAAFKRLAPMSRDEATAYLKDVVGDLLSGVHSYLLPFEAVYRRHALYPKESVADAVGAALERRVTSIFGPVPDVERFAPPEEDRARAIIERRYGPMLRRLEDVE